MSNFNLLTPNLETIKSTIEKYIHLNILTYEFFGKGLMGGIGVILLELSLTLIGFIYLLCVVALIKGYIEMTGADAAEWFGGVATLITGILALCAAWWTVSKMEKQISVQQTNEASNRERNLRAELTILPVVLANICFFAEEYGKLLAEIINIYPASSPTPTIYYKTLSKSYILPKISDDDISNMKNIVRFLEPSSQTEFILIKNIEKIIIHYQILKSREENGYYETGNEVEIEMLYSNIHYAAIVYSCAASMFKYARKEVFTLQYYSSEDVTRALSFFQLTEANHPTPFRYVKNGINNTRPLV